MSTTMTTIPQTHLFNINHNNIEFGCSQQWYPTTWQVLSGCGPTTASNMFYYLALTKPDQCKNLYPSLEANSKPHMLDLMLDVWTYITPTNRGVNKTEIFTEGAIKYAYDRNVDLNCAVFNVPNFYCRKQSTEEFLEFIQNGIDAGSPIGFLNLSNGKVENLHRWHWVNLFDLYEGSNGAILSTASDEGERKTFDMRLWYETTALGGGLVYFTV